MPAEGATGSAREHTTHGGFERRHPVPRPALVELVGPAGAGKSAARAAVLRALGNDAGTPLGGWRRRTVALAARHVSAWLPSMMELLVAGPRIARETARHVVRVRTMHAELPQARARAGDLLLLDEGPVFSLARLRGAKEATPRAVALEHYVRASVARWAAVLDAVVWLDAPDDVLTGRIRARAKAHRVKDSPDADVRDFLHWYRGHYEGVVADLAALGVRVVRIDTSKTSVEAVADRVLAVAGVGGHAR